MPATDASNAVTVDPTNAEQLGAWDGSEGDYWAARADHFDRAVGSYHERMMTAAAITTGDSVLDIGCGTGQTTCDAAGIATSGRAVGVDLSAAMLDVARRRAAREGVTNAFFEQADAQVHPFDAASFDVAISRTGAMFFGDLIAAFTNIRRGLRPGGRLCLVTWQPLAANEWIREFIGALAAGRDLPRPPPDRPGPFALSEPARVEAVLDAAGFVDVKLEPVSSSMWFGNDARDAFDFIVGLNGWMLEGLDDAGRDQAQAALRATMAAHETPDGVLFGSAGWLIQATRADD